MNVHHLKLFFRTLRKLRLKQIFYRLYYIAWPRFILFNVRNINPENFRFIEEIIIKPNSFDGNYFKFFGVKGCLSEIGWNSNVNSKLWHYNQHYFDYLSSSYAASCTCSHVRLIEDWILNSNLKKSEIGWDPYPTSLRIVNWIKFICNNSISNDLINDSLALQARWLEKNIEWHIYGNHLLANSKALIFAGLYFSGPTAERWLKIGFKILLNELDEQILKDGGHFERSPMYHCIILEDLLDLLNIIHSSSKHVDSHITDLISRKAELMLDWLSTMIHPDGQISFFNDCSFGVAAQPGELFRYAHDLGLHIPSSNPATVSYLQASGYVRIISGPAVVFLDAADVGPSYLPGHGHADTASFELSVFGDRILVNPGTFSYDLDEYRLYFRGTPAHNTVSINGKNSSEVWSSFRVARQARIENLSIENMPNGVSVNCTHDGFDELHGRPRHTRLLSVIDAQKLIVRDTVSRIDCEAVAHFHIHPTIVMETLDDKHFRLRTPGGKYVLVEIAQGDLVVQKSVHVEKFGEIQKSDEIQVKLLDGLSSVLFDWGRE